MFLPFSLSLSSIRTALLLSLPPALHPLSSRPSRVLFLSVLRRFSLFFRPAHSLKTGFRASAPLRAGRLLHSRSLARNSGKRAYVFYSADVRTRVQLVREYSEKGRKREGSRTALRRMFLYAVTIGDHRCCYSRA